MIINKETQTLNLLFEYMEKDLFIWMKETIPKKLTSFSLLSKKKVEYEDTFQPLYTKNPNINLTIIISTF